MPTYEKLEPFITDYAALTPAERAAFRRAVAHFVTDLRRGRFRPGLYVHSLDGHPGIFSMSWGYRHGMRATFEYGREVRQGHPHVIWRRVGDHSVYDNP